MGIYVEIPIHAAMDELWEKTQDPQLHQRWDLRFSKIEYLPREPEEPQKFLYRTGIGFALKIDGEGESTGTRDGEDGTRTSSLRFWSDDTKSLIKNGSGYWKYVPENAAGVQARRSSIRFFTWYEYETRFGEIGKVLDRCLFRPLLGWATAWSFDRLRLWLEKGIPPETSRDRTIIYAISRGTVAFIWLYHGLVPKLLYHDRIELDLLGKIGSQRAHAAANLAGFVEIAFALFLLIFWRQTWLLWLTIVLMMAGIPIVAINAPQYLTAAFNPVTLNVSLAALAGSALFVRRDLPTSTNCRRTPEKSG